MSQPVNFHPLSEEIASSGQPTPEQLTDIAAQGYRAVINLAMPDSDNALADEGSRVTGLGMSYYHIPVPFDAPTAEHLREFAGVMQSLQGKRIWVHCAVNARVSAFLYKYLHEGRGFSADAATTPLLKQWLPVMDDSWKAFLELPAELWRGQQSG